MLYGCVVGVWCGVAWVVCGWCGVGMLWVTCFPALNRYDLLLEKGSDGNFNTATFVAHGAKWQVSLTNIS